MKTRIPFYILVFLFSVFFLTGCTSNEKISESEELSTEGSELYEEREYISAKEKFVEALEIYPGNVDAYFGLVQIFLDKGILEEAADLAQEASKRIEGSDAADLYSEVGRKYYEAEQYEKALEMYEKALGSEGDHDAGRIGVAEANIYLEEIEDAKRALRGRSEDPEFYLLNAYLSLDNWEEGSDMLNEADLEKATDEVEGRISRLEEIYEIDDDDVLYKNTSLAGEYVNAGHPFLAIELLKDQDEEIEQYPDAQYFLGKAYLDHGNYSSAIENLNAAISLDIDQDDVYVNLARAYLLSGDLARAVETYETVSTSFTEEYVNVLLQNEMADEAEELILGLIEKEETIDLNMILSKVYYEKENFEKMAEVIEKLDSEKNLTQSETRNLKRYKLLYATEEIEDEEEIESLIERFSVFDRYNPEIYLFKGKLLKHQGSISEAKDAFERAVELDLEGEVADKAHELLASMD